MIIILDGPDGAGKSTLATALAARLSKLDNKPVVSVHHGPYAGLDGQGLSKVLFRSLAAALVGGSHVIMDRCWLSEPIYAKAYGRPNRLTRAHQRMLERCALAGDAQLVLCMPSFDTCYSAWASGRDEYITSLPAFRELYEDYEDVVNQTDLPWHTYDYTVDNTDSLMADLLAASTNKGPGAGAWRPGEQVLLIGDKPNMKGHGADTVIVPFINFNGTGCSEWLADQLEAAGVSERDIYWINATNARGDVTPSDFIEELKPAAIIALGRAAAEWCIAHNVNAKVAPHPQYHKRFYFNRRYPVPNMIKEALNA